MIYLSASSIKDFIDCPLRLKFRSEVETRDLNSGLIVGTRVHHLIEKYWNHPDFLNVTKKEILDLNQEEQLKAGICLYSFNRNYLSLLSEKDRVELEFKLPLSKNVSIVGKMDRILPNGVVIDWKTNTKAPNKVDNDVQFIIYYWAYTQLYNTPPAQVLNINLFQDKITSFYKTESYDFLFNEIIPYILKCIKDKKYPHLGYYNGSCYNCQFKSYCHSGGQIE